MRTRRYILAAILGGLLMQSAFAAPGHGDDRERHIEAERQEHAPRPGGGRMTPGEAAERAQRNNGGGRVLAVDPTGNGYRVKLLQRGDVNIVFVPAE